MPETTQKVTLARFTPNPTETIAAAARLCYAENTEHILDASVEKAESPVQKHKRSKPVTKLAYAKDADYDAGNHSDRHATGHQRNRSHALRHIR
jgi:hypothetical protein